MDKYILEPQSNNSNSNKSFKRKNPFKKFSDRNHFLTPARSITLGFFAIILVGAFILCLPIAHEDRQWFNFVDALFTATSAVCVTGLAVVDTAITYSMFGEIVILLLIQIGGLGFMTIATMMFIMLGKRIGLKDRMAIRESLSENSLKGMVTLIRLVVKYTLLIELIGAIIICTSLIPEFGWGEGIYKSIFLSISAFCNAGFDLFGTNFSAFCSLEPFAEDGIILLAVSSLVILGGLGFAVISEVFTKKAKSYKVHTKYVLLITGILITLGTGFFMIAEYNNPKTIGDMNFGYKLLNSFFQSVTPRTAGFAAVNQTYLTDPSMLMTSILMFIGASPASTGGGIKTTTLLILTLSLWHSMRGKEDIILNKRTISHKLTMKAFSILSFAIVLIGTLTILLAIFERNNPHLLMNIESFFFESISAFSTVGLSQGITPYLSDASKIAISVVMFAGRIGPINLGWAILHKITKEKTNIKYPDIKILVG